MKKTKLFQLLRTFSSEERVAFSHFLACRLYNERRDVLLLWEVLRQGLEKKSQRLDKQEVYHQVYSGADFDDQQLRLTTSELLRKAEDFVVSQEMAQEEELRLVYLLDIYRRRDLAKHFRGVLRRSLGRRKRGKQFSISRLWVDFRRSVVELQTPDSNKRTAEPIYQALLDNLDQYYLAEKLRLACLAQNHANVFRLDYDYGLQDEWLEGLDESIFESHPVAGLYYYGYRMQQDTEEERFFVGFKRNLLEHATAIPQEEQRDLFVLATNFCARKYNQGKKAYMRQANELYKRGLSLGAFFVDGVLSRFTFRNIVTNGLILEEYAWVGQFIEQYQSYLSDTSRASMVSFNQARLEYRQKNYGKALDLLQKSDYRDVLLNLSAKTLLVKVFYEMGEYDLLESHLQAMRVFIRRKKELAYQQENFQKLVYFAQKMIELNPFDRQAKEQLREEITKRQVVAEKAWLLEMLG